MAKSVPSLGELELQVLRVVWEEQPCSERHITERIQKERSVVRTTVLKTVQRLEAKGLLVREKGGGPIRYRATLSERRVLPGLIRQFVERVLGGSPERLVAYFTESGKLSAKDLEVLREIAKKVGQKRE